MSLAFIQGPGQLEVAVQDAKVIATTVCAKFECMAVDMSTISVSGTSVDIGAMDQPTSASDDLDAVDTGVFAIAQEGIAAGKSGRFRFKGITKAIADGGGWTLGDALAVDATGDLTTAGANKIVAYALETVAANQTGLVWFDGINGFGGPTA
jgi:hypothetical protein